MTKLIQPALTRRKLLQVTAGGVVVSGLGLPVPRPRDEALRLPPATRPLSLVAGPPALDVVTIAVGAHPVRAPEGLNTLVACPV